MQTETPYTQVELYAQRYIKKNYCFIYRHAASILLQSKTAMFLPSHK